MKNLIALLIPLVAVVALSNASTSSTSSAPCDETTDTCTVPADPAPDMADAQRCHSTVNRYLIEEGPNKGSYCRIRTCTRRNLVTGEVKTTDQPVDCVKPAVQQ